MSVEKNQYDEGVSRVSSLLALYENLQKEGSIRKSKEIRPTDILRAALVLLHSAEEDYFRNILVHWYPLKADSKAMSEVSLAGSDGRTSKYSFDRFASFSGKTVDEVISESVREHFSRMSFNSYKDIDSRLKKIGISLAAFQRQADIDKLIQRRHKVVHEVDLVRDASSGKRQTRSIKSAQVRTWMECSMSLVQMIDDQVSAWESQEELESPVTAGGANSAISSVGEQKMRTEKNIGEAYGSWRSIY